MDWDWEDGPPQEAPHPREREPEAPLRQDLPEDPPRETAPAEPPSELELDQPPEFQGTWSDRPSLERPRVRTIEAAQRAVATPPEESRPQDRPRSTENRAAARAQRRRQLRLRRLIALAVVVAVVVLLVFLFVRGCGGPDAGAATAMLGTAACVWLPPAVVERP